MQLTSIFYPVVIFFCLFLIFRNVNSNKNYNVKNDNIEVLYVLNEYSKGVFVIFLLIILMLIPRVLYIIDTMKNNIFNAKDAISVVILPILIIALYLSVCKKTKITTIGIIKKNYLVRWEDIKKISYLEPDIKGKQKVRIFYKYNRKNLYIELVFNKFDNEIEKIKKTANEYLNSNKKLVTKPIK